MNSDVNYEEHSFSSYEEASQFTKETAKRIGKTISMERSELGWMVRVPIVESPTLDSDSTINQNRTKAAKKKSVSKKSAKKSAKKSLQNEAVKPPVAVKKKDQLDTIEWLSDARIVLLKTIANIMQTSTKDSSRLVDAVVYKSSAVAGAGGVLGLISVFGSASTGTAISTLSGAAASNATFYWLGSLVGGGVFMGSIMAGGIGLLAAHYGMKWWKGKPRNPDELTVEENAIIEVCITFIKAFDEQITGEKQISKKEGEVLISKGWMPLLEKISDYDERSDDEGDGAISTLNFKNYIGLGRRTSKMKSLSEEMLEWINEN